MPLSLLLKILNDNLVNICVINFLLQTSFLVPKKSDPSTKFFQSTLYGCYCHLTKSDWLISPINVS